MAQSFDLDAMIRKVPDFPKKGILFYDITSILVNPKAFRYCIDSMVELYGSTPLDGVAAIESRGFLFAAPFCEKLGLPLMLVRKKGKLPGKTIGQKYELEYGEAEIEMHAADVPQGGKVLLVDDLIATGGSAAAAVELIRLGGATPVGVFAVIGLHLPTLNYETTLKGCPVKTLINYEGE